MEFGVSFDTHVNKWDLIRYAEELGYDRAWVADSQMIWSDCYATLALVAFNTKRIKIGAGVAVAGTRIAPVTVHSIASINQIAPGRTFLGLGTGHTAMRVMGQPPMRIRDFGEYLRVVRQLLNREPVEYTYQGRAHEIQFLHQDRRYINLDDPIPLYVAANAPKALELTGAYGDGWIVARGVNITLADKFVHIEAGARAAGRALPKTFHTAALTTICLLRPGESLASERVVNLAGSQVGSALHFAYESWKSHGKKDADIPPFFANKWDEYLARIERLPENARARLIHEGHGTFLQPEERKFVTPEAIRGTCVVGTPEEVIAQLRVSEKAGLREAVLKPPAEYQREVLRDVAELVMPAFR